MSQRLNDLSDRFRPLAIELLARLTEARIQVCIVDTLRTAEEHAANIQKGVSWTAVSKHLDGKYRGFAHAGSDAIDLAPYETYALHGPDKLKWDGGDIWLRIGQIGEDLGLVWGGRWKVKDLGHFEFPGPAKGPSFGSVEV